MSDNPEQMLIDDAIQEALTTLVQSHRTEFEQLISSGCNDRGMRYNSAWLDRFYKGM